MIARLRGTVIDSNFTHIVLDVEGVGYLIAVRITSSFKIGEKAELHTYLAVRENALDLYGFETPGELHMFKELLKLPKIGPKSAMQVLSQADIELLKKAVMMNDPSYLSKMSGIGKKSAEKIVAGLKDSFENTGTEWSGPEGDGDVLDALITLGYSQRDALAVVQKLPSDITDMSSRIKEALKLLTK